MRSLVGRSQFLDLTVDLMVDLQMADLQMVELQWVDLRMVDFPFPPRIS